VLTCDAKPHDSTTTLLNGKSSEDKQIFCEKSADAPL
jgi:hypothetical protein